MNPVGAPLIHSLAVIPPAPLPHPVTIKIDYGEVTRVTNRNRQAAALALACLCAALLTACTDKSPEAGRPSTAPTAPNSTPTATPTGSTPSQSTPATAPERPKAAEGLTLAAAEAFVGYYISLQNYAYTTGNAQHMLEASDKGCLGCQGISDFVKISNGSNGGLVGDYLDRFVGVKEVAQAGGGRVAGSAEIRTGAYKERPSPSASLVPRSAGSATLEVTLTPMENSWVMYEMEINE